MGKFRPASAEHGIGLRAAPSDNVASASVVSRPEASILRLKSPETIKAEEESKRLLQNALYTRTACLHQGLRRPEGRGAPLHTRIGSAERGTGQDCNALRGCADVIARDAPRASKRVLQMLSISGIALISGWTLFMTGAINGSTATLIISPILLPAMVYILFKDGKSIKQQEDLKKALEQADRL